MGRPVFLSLCGEWTGVYTHDLGAVPFNATLEEEDGRLTGRINEPNTFAPTGVARLFASLTGSKAAETVRFVKAYDGAGGVDHTVAYDGACDAAFVEIRGVWRISPFCSGPFVMTRVRADIAVAVDRAAGAQT